MLPNLTLLLEAGLLVALPITSTLKVNTSTLSTGPTPEEITSTPNADMLGLFAGPDPALPSTSMPKPAGLPTAVAPPSPRTSTPIAAV